MRFYKVLLILMAVLISVDGVAHGGQRNAEITFQVTFSPSPEAKQVRLWVPYPMSDQESNKIFLDKVLLIYYPQFQWTL